METIKQLPKLLGTILTTTLLKILQIKLYMLVLVFEDEMNYQLYTS